MPVGHLPTVGTAFSIAQPPASRSIVRLQSNRILPSSSPSFSVFAGNLTTPSRARPTAKPKPSAPRAHGLRRLLPRLRRTRRRSSARASAPARMSSGPSCTKTRPKGDDERKHRVSIYEKPDWWKGYDVVVHNECFGAVDDNAFVEGIAAAHKAGVPAVMLHCSSHSYRAGTTDEWRKCGRHHLAQPREEPRPDGEDHQGRASGDERLPRRVARPEGRTLQEREASGRTACRSRKPTARTPRRTTSSSG